MENLFCQIEHLTAHHRAMTRILALMLDHPDIDLRHQCQELNHTDLFELDNLVLSFRPKRSIGLPPYVAPLLAHHVY